MRPWSTELWGSARGPVMRARPQNRLGAGMLTFAACMVSSGATAAGTCCTGAATLAWLLICRPPRRAVGGPVALGLAMLLPLCLLLFLLPGTASAPVGVGLSRWTEACSMLLRGLSGMLVCVATAASLDLSDLATALLGMHVPRMVAAILLQILHQTSLLIRETRQIANAMAVRGACAGGTSAARVLFTLPRVWLPRVLDRAERVGDAMDLRGFCELGPSPERMDVTAADVTVTVLAVSALALAITLRTLGVT